MQIINLTMASTRHISGLKYAPTHGTFPNFIEMDKTAGAYSLQIYDYLSQMQRKTKSFLLIVRQQHQKNWRHRMLFFFVPSKNRVSLVLFFKPWAPKNKAPKNIRIRYRSWDACQDFRMIPSFWWAADLETERSCCWNVIFASNITLNITVSADSFSLIHSELSGWLVLICAWPGDYHSLSLTRTQFHSPHTNPVQIPVLKSTL